MHRPPLVRDALMQLEEESLRNEEILGVAPKIYDLDDSDGSASDVEDQDDVELDIANMVPDTERRMQPVSGPQAYEQHRLYGIRHLIADDSRFACGRVRSLDYLPCEDGSAGLREEVQQLVRSESIAKLQKASVHRSAMGSLMQSRIIFSLDV